MWIKMVDKEHRTCQCCEDVQIITKEILKLLAGYQKFLSKALYQ